jgi:hypothetical protein
MRTITVNAEARRNHERLADRFQKYTPCRCWEGGRKKGGPRRWGRPVFSRTEELLDVATTATLLTGWSSVNHPSFHQIRFNSFGLLHGSSRLPTVPKKPVAEDIHFEQSNNLRIEFAVQFCW